MAGTPPNDSLVGVSVYISIGFLFGGWFLLPLEPIPQTFLVHFFISKITFFLPFYHTSTRKDMDTVFGMPWNGGLKRRFHLVFFSSPSEIIIPFLGWDNGEDWDG